MASSTREVIFAGHPFLGRLFTLSEWKVFILGAVVSSAFLILPAWLINIHSIPVSTTLNEGFLYTYNWSLMYPITLPLLLSMAVSVSRRMNDCVTELCVKKRITVRKGHKAGDYPTALAKLLESRARLLIILAVIVAVVTTIVDTHDLWPGFYSDHVPSSRNPGWDTIFNATNWGERYATTDFQNYLPNRPSKNANLIFDLVAYSFQGVAFFLGLFWMGKFTLYLFSFARLIGGKDADYQFNPLTKDMDFRMGLKPMGGLFNSFLAITTIAVGFALFHRIYLIDSGRGNDLFTYVRSTFWNVVVPAKDDPIPAPFNHFTALFKADSWGFDCMDASAVITILFMTIPIVVICFLPLWRIRSLVNQRRHEELERLQLEYEKEFAARNNQGVQLVVYEQQCLQKSNIWPNGDSHAKRYLTTILALAAGAFAPPLLAIVLIVSLSDGLVKYVRVIFPKKTE